MQFGALIIGDEILSGKRQDKHFTKAIDILKARGLGLAWVQYLGDDPARITATLKRTFAANDIVFSFGGIGATPDDHTRQCAAAALGVPLERHAEAVREIEARFGAEAYPKRVLMAEFPRGATIIPNPYNRIAAFSVREHHFLPGFPEMAWPMMEWVLDTKYTHLFGRDRVVERAIIVHDGAESVLLDAMNHVVATWPRAKLSSLPKFLPEGKREVELAVRGDESDVAAAMAYLRDAVRDVGYTFTDKGA